MWAKKRRNNAYLSIFAAPVQIEDVRNVLELKGEVRNNGENRHEDVDDGREIRRHPRARTFIPFRCV